MLIRTQCAHISTCTYMCASKIIMAQYKHLNYVYSYTTFKKNELQVIACMLEGCHCLDMHLIQSLLGKSRGGRLGVGDGREDVVQCQLIR